MRVGAVSGTSRVTADQFMSANTNGMQLTALQTGNRLYPLWPSANDPDLYYSIACTNPIYMPEAHLCELMSVEQAPGQQALTDKDGSSSH